MAIIILIDICILNIVVVIVGKNSSIIWMGVPLLILPLEAIIAIRRIEVVPSAIISCIVVIIGSIEVPIEILAKVVVVGASVFPLEVFILSL